MSELSLKAIKRESFKGSDLTKLRTNEMVPGVFYGSGQESIAIAVKNLDLRDFVYSSESHLINLTIDGNDKNFTCILKDVQFDPVKYKPIHFDLLAIIADEKIKVDIPVHVTGTPIGVKEGGVLQLAIHKLEVECLPKYIPANIEVNVEDLKIGESIRVSDLKTENFEILHDPADSIVSVTAQATEEIAEPEATDEGQEPEVMSKGKKEEES
ncbi:50S ribosomal protein L25 [Ignavibacteria bacterium CHB1]|nr:MAG: 50S ribosomal protein L25 [Chlorobiota bacterium]MBV6398324.1 50S ribosomal protein L25 [Ignavibacteria bacterium]MCC6886085.1 50S ribosomal protein L25 [Ignavibacteriales bacterium]MCE7952663.1 50S ribosomal protein L25 [Chlorobi bacterium CHB7]MDL1886775.1 50S ribosomal protein L25 [Ignavibacteria bacterium CHB1]RIK50300.1 MAG: 50S ribosomal protein L25 [Ignavibacteriota bacterium]